MTDITSTTERVDYAARRHEPASEPARSRRARRLVAGVLFAVAFLALLVLLELLVTQGRVHPGVRVGVIDIGGMTPEAALAALESGLAEIASDPVVVSYGERSWEVSAAEIGLSFDYDAMVSEAMSVGRKGGLLASGGQRIAAWMGRVDVAVRPQADEIRMQAALDRIAEGTDVAPADARVRITGTTASVVEGSDGLGLDRDEMRKLILTAMVDEDRTVTAPVESVPVAIDKMDAEAARATAVRMFSGPVTIIHLGRSWQFQPETIASWIRFRRSDADSDGAGELAGTDRSTEVTLVAYISPKALSKTVIPAVGTTIGRPARNARFTTVGGRVSIVPSKVGIGPDLEALASDLTVVLTDGGASRKVELRTTKVEPELTTEEARAMGVRERLSRFTTTYDSGNRTRVNNIHLLGDTLDGQLIEPGGTFSFNWAVGERTAAKGYQEAGAIVNGRVVQQLGGGICQVGTTLFNAVLESGLPVIERRNHSFYISDYPKGRDATVSWGGPDLKFKNDTEKWVLISVSYTASSITIALYGTDPGYDVSLTTSEWRDIKPFPIEEIKDPTIEKGKKVIESRGVTGRTITVTRTVQKAGEVIRRDTFVSVYKPKVEIVRVGTKPISMPTTRTPSP